jgi:hypothetical protein
VHYGLDASLPQVGVEQLPLTVHPDATDSHGKELVNVTGDGTKAVYMFVHLAKMV